MPADRRSIDEALQKRIDRLTRDGRSNSEIARLAGVDRKTVRRYAAESQAQKNQGVAHEHSHGL